MIKKIVTCEPIRLDTNVRNTRPVGELTSRLGKMGEEYLYAVNDGPKPEIISYQTVEQQVEKIRELVDELIRKRKVVPDEIVILAPYKYTS